MSLKTCTKRNICTLVFHEEVALWKFAKFSGKKLGQGFFVIKLWVFFNKCGLVDWRNCGFAVENLIFLCSGCWCNIEKSKQRKHKINRTNAAFNFLTAFKIAVRHLNLLFTSFLDFSSFLLLLTLKIFFLIPRI